MEQKLYDAAAKLPETNLAFEDIQIPAKAPVVRPWRKIAVFAACAVLLIAVGFGTYAYAEEVKEYKQAVQFFSENGLSTEGLTRGEIKAVYRDITTESFTYAKTAEVLEKSQTTQQVPGYEIDRENNNLEGNTQPSASKYKYRVRAWVKDENSSRNSLVEKYEGDTVLWSVKITTFDSDGYIAVSDGVVIYGKDSLMRKPYILKISENGEGLWIYKLKNEEIATGVDAVVENTDGSYAAFSMGWIGDEKCICINQISADGQDISFKTIEMEDNAINCVARLGESYLLRLGDRSQIVKIDREGNVTESITYREADVDYLIQDMIEFNGRVYLSANAVPKADKESSLSNLYTELDVEGYIKRVENGEEEFNVYKFDITDRMKECYTAVLLVCDASTGKPQEFYAVKACRGRALTINDRGMLVWDVEDFVSVSYTPWFSAYTVVGKSNLYRYTFDASGKLLAQEKNDELLHING